MQEEENERSINKDESGGIKRREWRNKKERDGKRNKVVDCGPYFERWGGVKTRDEKEGK